MTPVRWSADSLADLDHIGAYVAQFDVLAAQRVVASIVAAVARLEQFPLSGVGTGRPSVRKLSVPRVRYILFYTVDDDEVVVLGIRHAARGGLFR